MSASTRRGTVVVTGASSGIGEATARHLAELGFDVFAGVRSDAAAERLGVGAGAQRIVPLRIDVTDAASIAAAAEQVTAADGGRGLAGLVNNAGIAVTAPLEYVPLDALRNQLEVNVIGQIAVTQAFIPGLRTARGRVVNVGSIGGRVAAPLLGPYVASKFALEGLTDVLRRELRPWGIQVSILEPATIATPIWGKGEAAADDLVAQMPPAAQQRYATVIAAVRAIAARGAREGLAPSVVAEVVEQALTARRPRTRYLVGREAKVNATVARLLPERAFDALLARLLAREAAQAAR